MNRGEQLAQAYELVISQGAILAELPIEEWLDQIERAETLAPALNPTLYRDYVHSGKGEVIKDILQAALVFKQAILKAREQVVENEALRR